MKRILFVFSWLVVGGEETEVRLLAQHLDPRQYQLDVVACFRKPNMPEQTHEQLAALGVNVDKTPYNLSFEDTVRYLAAKIPNYDVVVACQAVPDVYPALEQLEKRPPLIEHGGLVSEALAGPKHFTTRYVGVCRSICAAAASKMPNRPQHVVEIPSMVDLREFRPEYRSAVRREWRIADDTPVVGWVGRLDRKKRVEDFIRAAALLHDRHPNVRFMVIGGADAFMPEYADELHALTAQLGLQSVLTFLGDRPDVPRLLCGLDAFVWLSRGEGMPHVIAEAGAACLPVIATRDNGSEQQITDGVSGVFVAHESPHEVAAALERLIARPEQRRYLGANLRAKVEAEYAVEVVVKRWTHLFTEVTEAPQLINAARV
jgi:glycosyltransferase involved in cell wall biosynthesis